MQRLSVAESPGNMIRFALPAYFRGDDGEKHLAEVAVMRYISEKTSIPIPPSCTTA